jgi:uncharacterized protein
MLAGLELFGCALISSICGSMVGLGGGFILVPLLRLVFGLSPAQAAGTGLVLVTANSGAGALTYFLQRRVNVKLGLIFAAGGLPGSVIGAFLVHRIPEQVFDWLFVAFLLAVAGDMIFNATTRTAGRIEHAAGSVKPMSYRAAVGLGFLVGLVSSLFGIGGGVITVPSLLYFSDLPAHAISATSHFILILTAPTGLIVHALQHDVKIRDIVPLVAGGLCGGPIGARLSLKLKSPQLTVTVGIAMLGVATSLALRQLLRF